jgi:hypothetical protein
MLDLLVWRAQDRIVRHLTAAAQAKAPARFRQGNSRLSPQNSLVALQAMRRELSKVELRRHSFRDRGGEEEEGADRGVPYGMGPLGHSLVTNGQSIIGLAYGFYLSFFFGGFVYRIADLGVFGAIACVVVGVLPCVISAFIVAPQLITRYLMVQSLGPLNISGFDLVLEVRGAL